MMGTRSFISPRDDRIEVRAIDSNVFELARKWSLETPELEALAAAEQAARYKTDVWKGPIVKWLGTRKDTSVAEVLKHALGFASMWGCISSSSSSPCDDSSENACPWFPDHPS